MELLTDVLAIAGWFSFGICLPCHLVVFRNGIDAFSHENYQLIYLLWSATSFGLIAASMVLG